MLFVCLSTVREERCSQLGWTILAVCCLFSCGLLFASSSLCRRSSFWTRQKISLWTELLVTVIIWDFTGRRTASNHRNWPDGPQRRRRRRRRLHLSWHSKPPGCALAAVQCHSSLQLNNTLQKQLATDFCSMASTQVSVYAVVLQLLQKRTSFWRCIIPVVFVPLHVVEHYRKA